MDFFRKTIRDILKKDQLDRKKVRSGILDFSKLLKSDLERKNKIKKIIKKYSKKFNGHDYFNTSIIFLHSSKIKDLNTAEKLGQKSLSLEYKKAKKLMKVIEDRKLIIKGKKQKYGTQKLS